MDTASPEPRSAPTRSRFPRGPPAASSSDGRELPFDLMLDVLLCVPGKDLCRLRAVCRAWRAATADPHFVRAHAARHPDPLFLANLRDDDAHIQVMDLSGAVVKRIAVPEAHQLLCTRLDLACVATEWNSCRVLDPATGAVVPGPPVVWQGKTRNLTQRNTTFAFGQIATTGEYKLLRVSNLLRSTGEVEEQRFEVFTINGGADNARWRRLQNPDLMLKSRSAVVVDAVVYFLYNSMYFGAPYAHTDPDCIASFDLEREEWRDLPGPISSSLAMDEEEDMYQYISMWRRLTLAELKGSLVLSYYIRCQSDIWFLTDVESGLWVKEYSINTVLITKGMIERHCIKPLVVLSDGRLVVHLIPTGLLLIYDPRTNNFDEVGTGYIYGVAMYTGSLLSLPNGNVL